MPPNLNDCCTSLMLMPDCTRPLVDSSLLMVMPDWTQALVDFSLLMVMPDSCWRWCRTPVDRWPSPHQCYLLTIYTARPCTGAEWRNHCLSYAHLPKVCFHEVSIISRDFISETRANITLFHMHELETENVIIFITGSQIIFIFIISSQHIIIIENQKLWRVVEIWTQLKQTLYLVIINHDQTIQDSRTLLCQYVLLPNSLALHCL